MSGVLSFCKSLFSSSNKKKTNLETSNEGEELPLVGLLDDENHNLPPVQQPNNDFNCYSSDEIEDLETEERWKSFCETLSSSSTSAKKRTYSSRNSDDDDDENRSKKKQCPVESSDKGDAVFYSDDDSMKGEDVCYSDDDSMKGEDVCYSAYDSFNLFNMNKAKKRQNERDAEERKADKRWNLVSTARVRRDLSNEFERDEGKETETDNADNRQGERNEEVDEGKENETDNADNRQGERNEEVDAGKEIERKETEETCKNIENQTYPLVKTTAVDSILPIQTSTSNLTVDNDQPSNVIDNAKSPNHTINFCLSPEELNQMGKSYENGTQYLKKDKSKAFEFYSKCAELGNTDALYEVGRCYKFGIGVIKSFKKAVEYYTKAAELGHKNAQCNLGCCYDNGEGVTKSYEKAVEYWTKAAEQGHRDAQYNLAECYYYGEGVSKSYERAVEYYTKQLSKDIEMPNFI